jgi:5-carboxymethyl-2-hydroxymuconate isomerase
MPHIVIEYSENLEVIDMMQDLQKLVCEFGLFNPDAVKSRSVAYQDYILPNGYDDFVHVTLSILEGREEAAKQKLADEAFVIMQRYYAKNVKLSFDIREMFAISYRKN